MSKFSKIIVILAVVIIITGVLLVFNINPIVENFRPDLARILSDATKSDVSLGKIDVRLFPTTAVRIENVKLENKSSKTKENISINTLALETNLLNLLNKKLSVKNIVLEGANININRDKNKKITVGGISADKNRGDKDKEHDSDTKKENSAVAIDLQQVKIIDANVIFTDESTDPVQPLKLANLNADLSEINLQGGAKVDLTANLLSEKKENLTIKGLVADPKSGLPLDAKITLAAVDMQELPRILGAYNPNAREITLIKNGGIGFIELTAKSTSPKNLEGNINFSINDLSVRGPFSVENDIFSAQNLDVVINKQKIGCALKLNSIDNPTLLAFVTQADNLSVYELLKAFSEVPATITTTNSIFKGLKVTGSYNLKEKNGEMNLEINKGIMVAAPIEDVKLATVIAQNTYTIKPSSLKALGGEFTLSGHLQDNSFESILAGSNVNLETVFKTYLPVSKVSVTGNLKKLSSDTRGDIKNIQSSLNGDVQILVGAGNITGLNILGETLGKITEIPGVGQKLSATIPEKFQSLLTNDSSPFDSLDFAINFQNGLGVVQNAQLTHHLYLVTGQGEVDLNGKINLKAQLRLTPELTQAMVLKEQKLKLLLDSNNNLVIPITIKKENEKFLVLPDTSQLLERAAKNTAKEAVSRELQKVAPKLGGAGKILDSIFK